MTERPTPRPEHPDSGPYEIRLKGHIDAHWTSWFDGSTVTQESDGTTVISSLVVDQAALHGLLQRVRDLGLPLVSVIRVDDGEAPITATDARSMPTTRSRIP